MANNPGEGPKSGKELPQHPLVEQLKPDPTQPARKTTVLTGLPGNSDRPGYQRLYLTTKLDYYAEFLAQDILKADTIAADQSPFPGIEATRVAIARDAVIHYIWARSAHPVDEFDLDVRLGAVGGRAAAHPGTGLGGGPGGTCDFCPTDDTCRTCDTCPRTQCDTCHGQTCHTCQTCPGQTCQTCNTCPGHATCGTCHTCGDHATCSDTCTCETCVNCCEVPATRI